jgi:hypothetical protein
MGSPVYMMQAGKLHLEPTYLKERNHAAFLLVVLKYIY